MCPKHIVPVYHDYTLVLQTILQPAHLVTLRQNLNHVHDGALLGRGGAEHPQSFRTSGATRKMEVVCVVVGVIRTKAILGFRFLRGFRPFMGFTGIRSVWMKPI